MPLKNLLCCMDFSQRPIPRTDLRDDEDLYKEKFRVYPREQKIGRGIPSKKWWKRLSSTRSTVPVAAQQSAPPRQIHQTPSEESFEIKATVTIPEKKPSNEPLPPLPPVPKDLPPQQYRPIEQNDQMPVIAETGGEFTPMFRYFEQQSSSLFNNPEVDLTNKKIRSKRPFGEQAKLYQWSQNGRNRPRYPPHLAVLPADVNTGILQIVEPMKLISAAGALLPDMPKVLSDYLYGEPLGRTMAGLEARMAKLRRAKKNIGTEPSIANRPDWYSDAVFAQQSFTGPNPTSITQASILWLRRFKQAARDQENQGMFALLSGAPPKQLFVQDFSYFRGAVGASTDSMLRSDDGKRFGCATVTLFQLTSTGDLHPLAIVTDYRGSMEGSVTIFNNRKSPTDSSHYEGRDWAWRYAKMCHQVSDWTHHELKVHLNDCHFVQEAIIVATQRSFPADHIVHRLLEPHWLKTLSVNAVARDVVVPDVICKINGFTEKQTYAFIQNAYENYDFTKRYIPSDLRSRGFPTDELPHTDFHNYSYARNLSLLYPTLHRFVHSTLKTYYELPSDVAADDHISLWIEEMQSPSCANMLSFPNITTLSDLTDAIVYCLLLSGPIHHMVNYNKAYYQCFIPNKPPCLAKPPPTSLAQLLKFTEQDIIDSLPDEKTWMLASQFAFLAGGGGEVRPDENWGTYVKGLMAELRGVKGKEKELEAARRFYEELTVVGEGWERNYNAIDEGVRVRWGEADALEVGVSMLL